LLHLGTHAASLPDSIVFAREGVRVRGVQLLAVSAVLEACGGILVLGVGYGACFALWFFVFASRNRHDDDLDRARNEEFL
jgi:hypothetical protein